MPTGDKGGEGVEDRPVLGRARCIMNGDLVNVEVSCRILRNAPSGLQNKTAEDGAVWVPW